MIKTLQNKQFLIKKRNHFSTNKKIPLHSRNNIEDDGCKRNQGLWNVLAWNFRGTQPGTLVLVRHGKFSIVRLICDIHMRLFVYTTIYV